MTPKFTHEIALESDPNPSVTFAPCSLSFSTRIRTENTPVPPSTWKPRSVAESVRPTPRFTLTTRCDTPVTVTRDMMRDTPCESRRESHPRSRCMSRPMSHPMSSRPVPVPLKLETLCPSHVCTSARMGWDQADRKAPPCP